MEDISRGFALAIRAHGGSHIKEVVVWWDCAVAMVDFTVEGSMVDASSET